MNPIPVRAYLQQFLAKSEIFKDFGIKQAHNCQITCNKIGNLGDVSSVKPHLHWQVFLDKFS